MKFIDCMNKYMASTLILEKRDKHPLSPGRKGLGLEIRHSEVAKCNNFSRLALTLLLDEAPRHSGDVDQ